MLVPMPLYVYNISTQIKCGFLGNGLAKVERAGRGGDQAQDSLHNLVLHVSAIFIIMIYEIVQMAQRVMRDTYLLSKVA